MQPFYRIYCCYNFVLVTMATDCPVTGQERSACAKPCNLTCSNYRDISCPTVCVSNGCQCPTGTVINEETNSCVAMDSCPAGKPSQLVVSYA